VIAAPEEQPALAADDRPPGAASLTAPDALGEVRALV
jgi:hypothetical protein